MFCSVKVEVTEPLVQTPKDCEAFVPILQFAADDETGVSVVMFVKSLLVSESVILHVIVEPCATD